MKKLFFIYFLILSTNLFAQDIIIITDGNEIKSKVIEITSKTIKYKKFDYLDGPIRNINISNVFMVIYENGEREKFTTLQNEEKKTSKPQENVTIENKPIIINHGNSEQLEDDLEKEKIPNKINKDIVENNQNESIEIQYQSKTSSINTQNTISENKVQTETNKVKPLKTDYNGKYSFLSLGYGNSYGGLGMMGQWRVGQEFGFGMHAGVGYFPNAKYLASIGAKLFLYKGLYFNIQYGRTGWEQLSTYTNENSDLESHVLKGYSYMVGADWVWGKKKKVGLNLGIGITKNNNVKHFVSMEKTLAIDVGLVFR